MGQTSSNTSNTISMGFYRAMENPQAMKQELLNTPLSWSPPTLEPVDTRVTDSSGRRLSLTLREPTDLSAQEQKFFAFARKVGERKNRPSPQEFLGMDQGELWRREHWQLHLAHSVILGSIFAARKGRVKSFAEDVKKFLGDLEKAYSRETHDLVYATVVKEVIGTFVACWDPDSPASIYQAQVRKEPDLAAFVKSSLDFCEFIGYCAEFSLLPLDQVRCCMRLLLARVNYVEHVQGLRRIISAGKHHLFMGPCRGDEGTVTGFVRKLKHSTIGPRGRELSMRSFTPEQQAWYLSLYELDRAVAKIQKI